MVNKIIHTLSKPIHAYLDLTVSEPCKTLIENSKNRNKKNERPRGNGFSIRQHIKRQREMTSPEVASFSCSSHNLRSSYVKEMQVSPVVSELIH
jgi:hypothetical protein